MEAVKRFLKEEEGVTTLEYAVLAALIVTAVVTAVGIFTGGLDDIFQNLLDRVNAAIAPAAGE